MLGPSGLSEFKFHGPGIQKSLEDPLLEAIRGLECHSTWGSAGRGCSAVWRPLTLVDRWALSS